MSQQESLINFLTFFQVKGKRIKNDTDVTILTILKVYFSTLHFYGWLQVCYDYV